MPALNAVQEHWHTRSAFKLEEIEDEMAKTMKAVTKQRKVCLNRRLNFQNDKALRHQSKYRRAKGLFKKGFELAEVTGCELFIFMKDEFSKATYWGTDELGKLFQPVVDSLTKSAAKPTSSVQFVTPTKNPDHLQSTVPDDDKAHDLHDMLDMSGGSLLLSSTPVTSPRRSHSATPSPRAMTPRRSQASTPRRKPATTPWRSQASTPRRSPATTPHRTPATTPRRTPATTPRRTPATTPRRTPATTPRRTPATTPRRTPAKTPRRSPATITHKSPDATPRKPLFTTQARSQDTPDETIANTSTSLDSNSRPSINTDLNPKPASNDVTPPEEKQKPRETKKKKKDVYIVEAIEGEREVEGNKEYFIKWKTWARKYNTWEPECHILDKGLITAYEKKKNK